MVTKRDDNQPTDNRVNIEQSASGRLEGRVLQFGRVKCSSSSFKITEKGLTKMDKLVTRSCFFTLTLVMGSNFDDFSQSCSCCNLSLAKVWGVRREESVGVLLKGRKSRCCT